MLAHSWDGVVTSKKYYPSHHAHALLTPRKVTQRLVGPNCRAGRCQANPSGSSCPPQPPSRPLHWVAGPASRCTSLWPARHWQDTASESRGVRKRLCFLQHLGLLPCVEIFGGRRENGSRPVQCRTAVATGSDLYR